MDLSILIVSAVLGAIILVAVWTLKSKGNSSNDTDDHSGTKNDSLDHPGKAFSKVRVYFFSILLRYFPFEVDLREKQHEMPLQPGHKEGLHRSRNRHTAGAGGG